MVLRYTYTMNVERSHFSLLTSHFSRLTIHDSRLTIHEIAEVFSKIKLKPQIWFLG